jgi:hypothetical protein
MVGHKETQIDNVYQANDAIGLNEKKKRKKKREPGVRLSVQMKLLSESEIWNVAHT